MDARCPELIIAPCKPCDAHTVAYLYRDDRGHSIIKCPNCEHIIFDRPPSNETDRFIKNQRSYYAIAAEVMPEFAGLEMPGDSVPIVHPKDDEHEA